VISGANPRILVTGAGGPSAVSFMRALADDPLSFFAGDIDPHAVGLYLVVADRRRILPRGDDPDFVERLLRLCIEDGIDVLVPTVDSELIPLAAERERFREAGVELLIAPIEALRTCLDKWALMQICRQQIQVPRSALFDDSFDPGDWELPIIVKPRSGSGSRGIHLVSARSQLDAIARSPELLVQANLPGTEYSLDVLATRSGEVRAVVPRARLKVDSGIAVTGRTVRDARLEEIGKRAVEVVGLNCVSNVQVKEDADGVPALIEINPRFPGTMPLTVASGVNMPRLCLGEALGNPIPEGPLPFEEIAMVRYLEERFLAVEEISALERIAEAEGVPA
jgi:carbamoyl-phosphate synthase large subunit